MKNYEALYKRIERNEFPSSLQVRNPDLDVPSVCIGSFDAEDFTAKIENGSGQGPNHDRAGYPKLFIKLATRSGKSMLKTVAYNDSNEEVQIGSVLGKAWKPADDLVDTKAFTRSKAAKEKFNKPEDAHKEWLKKVWSNATSKPLPTISAAEQKKSDKEGSSGKSDGGKQGEGKKRKSADMTTDDESDGGAADEDGRYLSGQPRPPSCLSPSPDWKTLPRPITYAFEIWKPFANGETFNEEYLKLDTMMTLRKAYHLIMTVATPLVDVPAPPVDVLREAYRERFDKGRLNVVRTTAWAKWRYGAAGLLQ